MKAVWYNPFFIAFCHRIREIVPQDAVFKIGKFHITDEMRSSYDVSVVSTITGDILGKVLLSMQTNVALELAEAMMGRAVDSFETEAQSAVQELMNMVAGNALISLADEGMHVIFSPPVLYYSQRASTVTDDCPIAITLPLYTGGGEIEMNVAVHMNDSK